MISTKLRRPSNIQTGGGSHVPAERVQHARAVSLMRLGGMGPSAMASAWASSSTRRARARPEGWRALRRGVSTVLGNSRLLGRRESNGGKRIVGKQRKAQRDKALGSVDGLGVNVLMGRCGEGWSWMCWGISNWLGGAASSGSFAEDAYEEEGAVFEEPTDEDGGDGEEQDELKNDGQQEREDTSR